MSSSSDVFIHKNWYVVDCSRLSCSCDVIQDASNMNDMSDVVVNDVIEDMARELHEQRLDNYATERAARMNMAPSVETVLQRLKLMEVRLVHIVWLSLSPFLQQWLYPLNDFTDGCVLLGKVITLKISSLYLQATSFTSFEYQQATSFTSISYQQATSFTSVSYQQATSFTSFEYQQAISFNSGRYQQATSFTSGRYQQATSALVSHISRQLVSGVLNISRQLISLVSDISRQRVSYRLLL